MSGPSSKETFSRERTLPVKCREGQIGYSWGWVSPGAGRMEIVHHKSYEFKALEWCDESSRATNVGIFIDIPIYPEEGKRSYRESLPSYSYVSKDRGGLRPSGTPETGSWGVGL